MTDTETLPPYTGPDTACPKCGYEGANTRYRAAKPRSLWDWNDENNLRGPLPERLQRECHRCDFCWDEALQPTTPPATQATDLTGLAAAVRAEVESEVYEYRERTALWPEASGVTKEIARLATRGAMKAVEELLDIGDAEQRQPAHDAGPTVREAADADRNWDVEKAGER